MFAGSNRCAASGNFNSGSLKTLTPCRSLARRFNLKMAVLKPGSPHFSVQQRAAVELLSRERARASSVTDLSPVPEFPAKLESPRRLRVIGCQCLPAVTMISSRLDEQICLQHFRLRCRRLLCLGDRQRFMAFLQSLYYSIHCYNLKLRALTTLTLCRKGRHLLFPHETTG